MTDDIITGNVGSFSEEELRTTKILIVAGLLGNLAVIRCEHGEQTELVICAHVSQQNDQVFLMPIGILKVEDTSFDEYTISGKPIVNKEETSKLWSMVQSIGPGSDVMQ